MTKSLIPEVSILLPVHGDISFLHQTIESVSQQTFENFELIIVNDRLSSNAAEMVSRLIASDTRIKIITSKGEGLVSALNTGLDSSLGTFIARIDADDYMAENRLDLQLHFMKSHPDVAVVGTQIIFIDSDNRIIGKSRYPTASGEIWKTLTLQNCIGHPSVMFRKEDIVRAGSYAPFFQGAEDYALWTTVFQNSKIVNLDMHLTYYRITPGQYSRQLGEKSILLAESIRYKISYPNLFNPTILNSLISEGELHSFMKNCRKEVAKTDPSFVKLNICLGNVQRYLGTLKLTEIYLLIQNLTKLMLLDPKIFYRLIKYNMIGKFMRFFGQLLRMA